MASTIDQPVPRRSHGWRIARWSAAAGLLLTPLIAMQFDSGVNWTALDFAVAGALIGGVGLSYEVALRMNAEVPYRAGAAVALATTFLLAWANLAVGIVGEPGNPANAMFFGVLLFAMLACAIARLHPAGMALAMAATAITQFAAGAVALARWLDLVPVMFVTIFATAAWLLAAVLFHSAAAERAFHAES